MFRKLLCIAVLAAVASAETINLQDGLVAHYRLDGDATDSSASALNGTVHNATASSNRFGETGTAMYFDGAGDYLDMGNQAEWNIGTNSFSISLWIKPDGIASRKLGLVTLQNASTDVELCIGYGGLWYPDPEADDDKIGLGLNYYSSPPWGYDAIGSQSLADGNWHHISLTRSGSSWNVYLDGASTPQISGSYTFDPGSGQLLVGTEIPGDRFFAGTMDDVRIYSRALNSSEIAVLADRPIITEFRNGHLTWTNIIPEMSYTVEWLPSLTDSNEWSGSYQELQDIQSTNGTVTVPVPVYYRIRGVYP